MPELLLSIHNNLQRIEKQLEQLENNYKQLAERLDRLEGK